MDELENRVKVKVKEGIHEKAKEFIDEQNMISLRDLQTSLPSLKTVTHDEYLKAVGARWLYYDELWEIKTVKMRNGNKFRTRMMKHKVMDQFFQSIVAPIKERGNIPVLSYGAGCFNANIRGTVSSAYKHLRKRASIHAPVVMMNEYFTSQVCSCCQCKVKYVKRQKQVYQYNRETKQREKLLRKIKLHNVLRCPTKRKHNLLQRDLNSAKNMTDLLYHYLLKGERLAVFCPPKEDTANPQAMNVEEETPVIASRKKVRIVT
jgi:hypothetical protein